MHRLLCSVLCSALALASLSACGGSSSGQLPVDSPIMSFEPPDPEDLVEEPLDEEEDWEEGEDEAAAGKDAESL